MTLGEPDAVLIGHQGAVIECRRRETERTIEQKLTKCGKQQIGAAHHLRDMHRGIVDHTGELIGRLVVFAPDDEIAKVHPGGGGLRSIATVFKGEHRAVGHAETPVRAGSRFQRCAVRQSIAEGRTACPGIDRLVRRPGFAWRRFMRCARCLVHIAPRTPAGIHRAAGAELLDRRDVMSPSFALVVGPKRSADVGSFLPDESEPPQIFHHRCREIRPDARGIKILVAQHQCAARRLRALLRRPEGPRVAEMRVTGGGGREPPAINKGGRRHGFLSEILPQPKQQASSGW